MFYFGILMAVLAAINFGRSVKKAADRDYVGCVNNEKISTLYLIAALICFK